MGAEKAAAVVHGNRPGERRRKCVGSDLAQTKETLGTAVSDSLTGMQGRGWAERGAPNKRGEGSTGTVWDRINTNVALTVSWGE